MTESISTTTSTTTTAAANPTTAVAPKKLTAKQKQPDQSFLEAPFKELEATDSDENDDAIVFEDYSLEVCL